MYSDPILEEIRKYREQNAARFNYDTKAMVADLQQRQKQSGRPTVSRPPRRIVRAGKSAKWDELT